MANPKRENPQPSEAISALKDKHDLSVDTKVYVTKGPSGRKRKCDSRITKDVTNPLRKREPEWSKWTTSFLQPRRKKR